MKKKVCLSAIFALVVMMFVSGCSQDDGQVLVIEDTSSLTQEQVVKEVLPMLQGFLNAQYDYVIGKDKSPQWDKYLSSDATRSDTLKTQIDEMKENRYYSTKTKYIDYNSKLYIRSFSTITVSGDYWILDHIEDGLDNTEYRFSMYSDELSKEYEANEIGVMYKFVVLKVNGKWVINNWEEQLEFPVVPHRWFFDRKDPMGISADMREEKPTLRAIATTNYNRTAARDYAYAHYNSPNTNQWCDYTSNGGDCTNFVSQCLIAGGWTQITGSSFCSSSVWYHNGAGYCWNTTTTKNYSCSWAQAADLYSFLFNSSRVVPASYLLSSSSVGDIVQKYNNSGAIEHSMLVTKKVGTDTYVSYRNITGGSVQKDLNITSVSASILKVWKLQDSY
ncbi:MAG: amidase domain-containing protein [Candidatus Peribacteria bacterium]|jgi:hypothetical protein|nr:amidase domain-containing protein [Candidatus Peribacteria bacterium]